MATEIKLPELGEGIESATVLRIMVKAGDKVSQDQAIMELETDKAALDLPASAAGTVKEILVKVGDTLKVGQPVMTLEEGGEAKEAKPEAKPEPEKEPEAKPEKKEEKPEPPPKTEKPKSEEPKKEEPKTEEPPKQEPEPESEPPQEPEPEPQPAASAPPTSPASPALRRMARELGIDIHAVKGTSPDGRITKEDIQNHARSIILNSSVTGATGGSRALPDFSHWGSIERKAMTGIRRKIAEHVHDAWSSIPHVTQFDSADVTALEATRQELAKKVEEVGGKLTITAIMLKVVAAALKVFPQFNVSIDIASGEIISKKYCHIGVAVDTEHGLLVPVIRDVDKKNILQLSIELPKTAERARNRKLGVEEMQGGCFTITNLGGIGGSHFTPIINAPEVAILGVSRAVKQGDRSLLPLSLSYDHRAIDGADGARFIRWVAEAVENPLLISIEG